MQHVSASSPLAGPGLTTGKPENIIPKSPEEVLDVIQAISWVREKFRPLDFITIERVKQLQVSSDEQAQDEPLAEACKAWGRWGEFSQGVIGFPD